MIPFLFWIAVSGVRVVTFPQVYLANLKEVRSTHTIEMQIRVEGQLPSRLERLLHAEIVARAQFECTRELKVNPEEGAEASIWQNNLGLPVVYRPIIRDRLCRRLLSVIVIKSRRTR